MLNGKWSLGDVEDVEALVKAVLVAELAKRDVKLPWDKFDDFLARMLEHAWWESERFDPSRGLSLETFLRQQLKLRFIDVVRVVRGRTRWSWGDGTSYEREPWPLDLSLDAPASKKADGHSLVEALADCSSDSEADRVARTDVQLLAAIDLHAARDHALIQAAFNDQPSERARRAKARAA